MSKFKAKLVQNQNITRTLSIFNKEDATDQADALPKTELQQVMAFMKEMK